MQMELVFLSVKFVLRKEGPCLTCGEFETVNAIDLFQGKRVLVFSLPGAFTPTCTVQMLPDYELLFDKFKAIGIDAIYCTSVNDDYVMEAWARAEKIEKIEMIPDGNGELAESLGMLS